MTQTAQELRFSHDAQGRIVFNGQPYLYLSAGSLPEGQRRAEQKAAWLNECLDAAIKAQLTETQQALAEMTADRDSEARWAKQYHDNWVGVCNTLAGVEGSLRLTTDHLRRAEQERDAAQQAVETLRRLLRECKYGVEFRELGLTDLGNRITRALAELAATVNGDVP